MIHWHTIGEGPRPVAPPHKPWRVTRYRVHWYWGFPVGMTYEAHFRWYWQANLVSFLYHHLGRWSCNTWRRKIGTEAATI